MNEHITTKNFYEIMIPSAILTLVVAWCVMILFPFTSILLLGLILTLALAPMRHALYGMMGRKQKLASFIIVL